MRITQKHGTSWEKEHKWYSKLTGGSGHYFHEHVVIPKVLHMMTLHENSRLLDLACGSGVLARAIPQQVAYTGIDISQSLVTEARKQDQNKNHTYMTADVTEPFTAPVTFTHAAIILALQNIKEPQKAIANAAKHLTANGSLVIVLNHPAFRIPRQSSWGIDEQNKLQYRRINRYMSPLEIPITMHPGDTDSGVTWSYHLPISAYTEMLSREGFFIQRLEEWMSDKKSVGSAGKMENRARDEFPLFLAIKAVKK